MYTYVYMCGITSIYIMQQHVWGKGKCWCEVRGEELQGEHAPDHKQTEALRIMTPVETEESDISKTVETPYGKATVREIRSDGMVILQPNGMYELLLSY